MAAHDTATLAKRVEAGFSAARAGDRCGPAQSRHLDEFLALKLRQRNERRAFQEAGGTPLETRLMRARHSLQEARLNYEHAKEDVRLNCEVQTQLV